MRNKFSSIENLILDRFLFLVARDDWRLARELAGLRRAGKLRKPGKIIDAIKHSVSRRFRNQEVWDSLTEAEREAHLAEVDTAVERDRNSA